MTEEEKRDEPRKKKKRRGKKKKTEFFRELLEEQRAKGHDPHCVDMMEDLMRVLTRKIAPDLMRKILDDLFDSIGGRQVGILRKLHHRFLLEILEA